MTTLPTPPTGPAEPVEVPEAHGPVGAAARALLGADVRPLAGGYSGETFLVGASGEAAVLRIYGRAPDRAAVDAALLRLVRGLVPVPRVLDVRPAGAVGPPGAPAHLLTEYLPGERLELILPAAEPEARSRAGADVGRALARLAGVPQPRGGWFAGPDLTVRPWPEHAAELPDWVAAHRGAAGLADWSGDSLESLVGVAEEAQWLLDSVPPRVCLCHGDVNGKNLLADPASGALTGLVDWEFAHAGLPYTDLGNLLRFATDGVFVAAVLDAFRTYAPLPPGLDDTRLVALARAADLYALVDLAARAERNAVTDRAREVLAGTAATGDLAGGRPAWT